MEENITLTYSEEENAWCSDKITLESNAIINVEFEERGKLVIQKQNEADGPAPKIFMSTQETKEEQVVLKGHPVGKIIQIFTSVKPKSVIYIKL